MSYNFRILLVGNTKITENIFKMQKKNRDINYLRVNYYKIISLFNPKFLFSFPPGTTLLLRE